MAVAPGPAARLLLQVRLAQQAVQSALLRPSALPGKGLRSLGWPVTQTGQVREGFHGQQPVGEMALHALAEPGQCSVPEAPLARSRGVAWTDLLRPAAGHGQYPAMLQHLTAADWGALGLSDADVARCWRQVLHGERELGAGHLPGCRRSPCAAGAAVLRACSLAACQCGPAQQLLKRPPMCIHAISDLS